MLEGVEQSERHKEHSDSKQENSGHRARYFLKNQKLREKK